MQEMLKEWQGALTLYQGAAHYCGLAGDNTPHRHYACQLVFATGCNATVELESGTWQGTFLFIPSGEKHRLLPSPDPLDLIYIEPTLLGTEPVKDQSLESWLAFAQQAAMSHEDVRMTRAEAAIEAALGGKVTLGDIAKAAGLSKSGFSALFRAKTGMPLRRYVLWRRLYLAVKAIIAGADATTAAHSAGFADSAHFSRTMRETFGVSPTDSVLQIRMSVH